MKKSFGTDMYSVHYTARVQVHTTTPSLYHEPKCGPWVQVYTMSQILYHESKSITWVKVYNMSQSICPESKDTLMSRIGKTYLMVQAGQRVSKGPTSAKII